METDPISPVVRRIFIWSAPALFVIATVSIVVLMRLLLPAPHPAWSAERIAGVYRDNQIGILVGCFIFLAFCTLLVSWAAILIGQCRRIEGRYPFLIYAQMMYAVANFMIAIMVNVLWAVAAFRAHDISPEITRALNDVAFFFFTFAWSPGAAWFLIVALTVFSDKSPQPLYPRWVGYFSLWCALLEVPAGLVAFFKSGPFAYDGLISLYIPLAIFFVWMIGLTVAMLKVQSRDELHAQAGGSDVTAGTVS